VTGCLAPYFNYNLKLPKCTRDSTKGRAENIRMGVSRFRWRDEGRSLGVDLDQLDSLESLFRQPGGRHRMLSAMCPLTSYFKPPLTTGTFCRHDGWFISLEVANGKVHDLQGTFTWKTSEVRCTLADTTKEGRWKNQRM